jgi:hypothetical protein
LVTPPIPIQKEFDRIKASAGLLVVASAGLNLMLELCGPNYYS